MLARTSLSKYIARGMLHTSGGKAYLQLLALKPKSQKRFETYHDQKAMKKPRYEKKNTLPYLFTGLKTGIDFAFLFRGFTSGALQSCLSSNPILWILEQLSFAERGRRAGKNRGDSPG